MSMLTGFDFSADADARVLVLGSMPSEVSLRRQQYYAHPRNAFWPIMGELFGFDPTLPYPERLRALRANRVALWDVAHRCVRPDSLDAAMRDVEANDFPAFFAAHPQIGSIFFNGGKAEALYRQLVLPRLPAVLQAIPRKRLPSTSPAHAGMDFAAK
ncbi:MAG: DNA-deoxyinosine glycosylase, partial [Mariprofundaceae bacterium]|nr:DNA-deoxyinosine glycosylase [Mariprofundaceae bacterium]